MDLHNDFRKNFIIVSLYGNHCHHVCPEGKSENVDFL
jgi:hypothetical protein